jgi:hypothetical protein
VSIEDRVRTATEATAATVGEIRPLTLPDEEPPARPRRFRPLPTGRGWEGWLVPLAAAMVVIAVAATLVAVRNPPRAAGKASPGPAASHPAGSTPVAAPADPDAVPQYFVAISNLKTTGSVTPEPTGKGDLLGLPRPDSVVVADTLTGQRLATLTPPAGSTFIGVTGARDDRTFLLDSVPINNSGFVSSNEQRTWYLLKIRPGSTPA